MSEPLNNSHTTDGFNYRIPAEPLLISALGRSLWNALYLDDMVASMLYEAGRNIGEMRGYMAAKRVEQMKFLKAELQWLDAPAELVDDLSMAIKAYDNCRENYRNALAHATPYTVSIGDGNQPFQPGLKLEIGENQLRDIKNAEDLHKVAGEIEGAINPINLARIKLIDFWERFSQRTEVFNVTVGQTHLRVKPIFENGSTHFQIHYRGREIVFAPNGSGNLAAIDAPAKSIELLEKVADEIETHHL